MKRPLKTSEVIIRINLCFQSSATDNDIFLKPAAQQTVHGKLISMSAYQTVNPPSMTMFCPVT
jgi:hypothetical protein